MENLLIKHNPLLKPAILDILGMLSDGCAHERAALESAVLEADPKAFVRQDPAAVIGALIRHEAVSCTLLIDGEPYEGTLEDAQVDPAIADGAEVSQLVTIADEGRAILDEFAPGKKIRELFEAKPRFENVFAQVLALCAAQEGATREQIEAVVDASEEARGDAAAGVERVYPQFFIDSLEEAGAIKWDGAWHTC